MSHIGKKTIFLSPTLNISHYKNYLIFKGVNTILKVKINLFLNLNYKNNALFLKPLLNTWKKNSAFKRVWGFLRMQLFNTSLGLYKEHFLKLKFVGVGYKMNLKKNLLIFRLGFSHKIFCTLPPLVQISKIKKRPPTFILKSFDLNLLRETAFLLRSFKKPEPYKGKGIVFLNEFLKLKEGKKTKN
jgi:large subunit ribosomal protein L6